MTFFRRESLEPNLPEGALQRWQAFSTEERWRNSLRTMRMIRSSVWSDAERARLVDPSVPLLVYGVAVVVILPVQEEVGKGSNRVSLANKMLKETRLTFWRS